MRRLRKPLEACLLLAVPLVVAAGVLFSGIAIAKAQSSPARPAPGPVVEKPGNSNGRSPQGAGDTAGKTTRDGAPANALDNTRDNTRDTVRARRPLDITPEREAAAMTFVRQHHPELLALLNYLRDHRERDYQRAIRELFRTSERLAMIRERDSDRYQLELKAWKIQSRIQVLAARYGMERTDELHEELQAAIQDQMDTRIALIEFERDRARERLERIEAQLQRLQEGREQEIQRQLRTLSEPPVAPRARANRDN